MRMKIKFHTPETIAASYGEKRRKKEFENAKYLELIQHRNMRALTKVEIRGVVEEAYIKYAASQEIIHAEQLSSNAESVIQAKRKHECENQEV